MENLDRDLEKSTSDKSSLDIGVKRKKKAKTKDVKLRAQEYRKRKKEYLKILEDKNSQLQEENIYLKQENIKLKNLLSKNSKLQEISDDKTIIEQNEEFAYYNMSKILKEDPDKLRFSQIEYCADIIGEWSPHRI